MLSRLLAGDPVYLARNNRSLSKPLYTAIITKYFHTDHDYLLYEVQVSASNYNMPGSRDVATLPLLSRKAIILFSKRLFQDAQGRSQCKLFECLPAATPSSVSPLTIAIRDNAQQLRSFVAGMPTLEKIYSMRQQATGCDKCSSLLSTYKHWSLINSVISRCAQARPVS